jgi:E3 ubiquitin-protein ligase synoviolin
VTETLLALTIFKDEFESTFVLLFVSLLFLKVFHWLASDRIEAVSHFSMGPREFRADAARFCPFRWNNQPTSQG